jgi:hypothetical protein
MTICPSLRTSLSLALACVIPSIGHAQSIRFHGDSAVVTDRTIDGRRVTRPAGLASPALPVVPPVSTGADVCSATPVGWYGQSLPNGETGTLNPMSFSRSATINAHGRIAFSSSVDGAARNQGIFTADAQGLRIVALGCGGDGGSGATDGCGDPSPIGGSFSGFFGATFATPDINDNGDVLFLADIHGGSAPRGLFLYRAADATFEKVAAVGDPSPLGGTITTLGAGSMNNAGTVAFLAVTDGGDSSDVFLWQNGVTTKYVAAGDPAPGGGTFAQLGTEYWGYSDGTSIAGGPVPGINQGGMVSFRGYVSGGQSAGGLFLSIGGVHAWAVKAGDPTPDGGTYADFAAPLLNDNGEIAFFAERLLDSQQLPIWIAGSPGQWRKVFAPYDQVDGGIVWGTAYSRNPMRALNNAGDLVLWTSLLMSDQSERATVLLSHANGSMQTLATQGQPGTFGGNWGGSFDGWPSLNQTSQVRIGAATPGFALSSHVVVTPCTGTDVIFHDGFDRVAD